ncbi:MAG: DNA mismatch repair endonuclease MutL [Bacteroidales bacterium]|jgi:DNA mismatch repair protein MutL|nr:DNA mismatch repair endonuclease MutL [Bacteroidales bacterium]
MADIIQLLPDSVANQIAAGEVIQRPASVVKELLENALDAGATEISLIIKEAGKTLVQVVDNGFGMSETDARLCFEKHATSKIKTADDLFSLSTMGFRGEALASIAAISHVELKSKQPDNELGTCILIEGSEVISQNSCQNQTGTSISVKNLFYNVPARRNFLKSNTAELRHIIDEFQRVALTSPDVAYTFYNNGHILFQLKTANLKQRIIGIFGANYIERLVPLKQESDHVNIYGFIGKPEFAKKTRGEQFFFANNRFIKHPYFHHAVNNTFQELIPENAIPSYFIFIEVDPKSIDVNIHPTKVEVNFLDKRLIYAILGSSIKKALAENNLTPALDFETEPGLNFDFSADRPINPPQIKINPDYNPFESDSKPASSFQKEKDVNLPHWEKLYDSPIDIPTEKEYSVHFESKQQTNAEENKHNVVQGGLKYIITSVKSGLMIINQQLAHERILFEKYRDQFQSGKNTSQQLLFPIQLHFTMADSEIVQQLLPDLKEIGFDLEQFSQQNFVATGTPPEVLESQIQSILEQIIENHKAIKDFDKDRKINFAKSMARQLAIKAEKRLKTEEMTQLINELFACQIPDKSPGGQTIIKIISTQDIDEKFQ